MISEHTTAQYRNDAVYHALVDGMAQMLLEGRFTAWDLKQAADLAHEIRESELAVTPPRRNAMSEQLAKLLEPQSVKWRGENCNFTPALVKRVFGDGKQLVKLFPINERPRYWVVQVDSTDDKVIEILDDIYDAIDEQFGSPPDEDCGIGDERPYFPMYDGQGTAWYFVPQQ